MVCQSLGTAGRLLLLDTVGGGEVQRGLRQQVLVVNDPWNTLFHLVSAIPARMRERERWILLVLENPARMHGFGLWIVLWSHVLLTKGLLVLVKVDKRPNKIKIRVPWRAPIPARFRLVNVGSSPMEFKGHTIPVMLCFSG